MNRLYLVPVLALIAPAAVASAAPQQSPATLAAAGVCQGYTLLSSQDLAGNKLAPGSYYFKVATVTKVDVELVSGGGGGGAASDVHNNASTGSGGGAGEYGAGTYTLEAGRYFVLVGAGGAGGVSRPLGSPAPAGAAGGDTALGRCISGLDLVPRRRGGAGGKGDGNPNRDLGGSGASLNNPTTGVRIGTGGSGGRWQTNGADGAGWGSGGGGQGGTNTPGRQGGRGGNGYARVTIVG